MYHGSKSNRTETWTNWRLSCSNCSAWRCGDFTVQLCLPSVTCHLLRRHRRTRKKTTLFGIPERRNYVDFIYCVPKQKKNIFRCDTNRFGSAFYKIANWNSNEPDRDRFRVKCVWLASPKRALCAHMRSSAIATCAAFLTWFYASDAYLSTTGRPYPYCCVWPISHVVSLY